MSKINAFIVEVGCPTDVNFYSLNSEKIGNIYGEQECCILAKDSHIILTNYYRCTEKNVIICAN